MRGISLLLLGAALASCSYGPQPETTRSPSGQRAYDRLVAGKVPGRPISCVPEFNQNDMSIIDGHTIVFRATSSTSYVVHLSEGCGLLGSGTYALLSRQFGGTGLCRGDIQQVVDTLNHMTVGSCTVTDIAPYTRP